MKIGAVCELTKLSDRTVRHYIDEGLICPSYTKNYLGRKSFDFSDKDVLMLQSISVLRKFGFSILEIKAMIDDPGKSISIIQQMQQKKQETIQAEQELLAVLQTLEQGKSYTVPELADALNTPALNDVKAPEDPEDYVIATAFRFWFWVLCCPVLFITLMVLLTGLWEWPRTFLFVKFYPYDPGVLQMLLAGLVPFLFAGAMLIVSCRRCRRKRMLHTILAGAILIGYFLVSGYCLLYFVLSVETHFPVYSETEDPADYLNLGSMEREYEEIALLFPAEIPAHAIAQNGQPHPETTRYYNFTEDRWDRRFEVFAQWQLSQEKLNEEKARLLSAFAGRTVTQEQWGDWVFWSFTEESPVLRIQEGEHYEPALARNFYVVFAYREEDGLVRYFVSYADNHEETPGFLALDWE